MLVHEGEEVGTAAVVAVSRGDLQQLGLANHVAVPGFAASFLADNRPEKQRNKFGQRLARIHTRYFEKKLQDCVRQILPHVGLAIGCLSVQPYM